MCGWLAVGSCVGQLALRQEQRHGRSFKVTVATAHQRSTRWNHRRWRYWWQWWDVFAKGMMRMRMIQVFNEPWHKDMRSTSSFAPCINDEGPQSRASVCTVFSCSRRCVGTLGSASRRRLSELVTKTSLINSPCLNSRTAASGRALVRSLGGFHRGTSCPMCVAFSLLRVHCAVVS